MRDFVRYADFAAGLVNAPIETLEDLDAYLDSRQWLLAHGWRSVTCRR